MCIEMPNKEMQNKKYNALQFDDSRVHDHDIHNLQKMSTVVRGKMRIMNWSKNGVTMYEEIKIQRQKEI